MTDEKKKKLKAAIAGLMAHLDQENEKEKFNKWSYSGRKIIMQNNQLVQTRILKRF